MATDEGVSESRRAGSEAWGREREMIHNASTARETSNNNNKRRKKRRKKNQGKIRKLAGLRGMGEVWRMLRAFADSPTPAPQCTMTHRSAGHYLTAASSLHLITFFALCLPLSHLLAQSPSPTHLSQHLNNLFAINHVCQYHHQQQLYIRRIAASVASNHGCVA
jgi:hypothetical protein